MVNQKNKHTFSPDLVGEDCILASLEGLINSKVYHKSIPCIIFRTYWVWRVPNGTLDAKNFTHSEKA